MDERTRSGKVLTDADVQALADEAEAGYDVSRLQPRAPQEYLYVAQGNLSKHVRECGGLEAIRWEYAVDGERTARSAHCVLHGLVGIEAWAPRDPRE